MNSLKGGESSQSSLEVSQKGSPFYILNLYPLGQSAREKGASFFKLGNYEGAVNAFSEALQYDSQDIMYVSMKCLDNCFSILFLAHYQTGQQRI